MLCTCNKNCWLCMHELIMSWWLFIVLICCRHSNCNYIFVCQFFGCCIAGHVACWVAHWVVYWTVHWVIRACYTYSDMQQDLQYLQIIQTCPVASTTVHSRPLKKPLQCMYWMVALTQFTVYQQYLYMCPATLHKTVLKCTDSKQMLRWMIDGVWRLDRIRNQI